MSDGRVNRFSGKIAAVTGGASGIGAATVARLAEEGAHVLVLDRDTMRGAAVLDAVRTAGGSGAVYHVDLSDLGSIAAVGAALAGDFDAVHVLVNCAGIVRRAPLVESGSADWDVQVAINLRAPAMLSQALLPLLTRQGGAIVNVASEAGFRARPGSWVYDATKAGICAFTRSCAAELVGQGVRVNAVAPGWTVTEMHFGHAPDPAARRLELEQHEHTRCLMGRLGRPNEIAAAIAFLASDDASYITATVLHVNGGLPGTG
jgi:NAD(P)-dependent dehydrogenase (short-subunit alcohol dehydrogenase family)